MNDLQLGIKLGQLAQEAGITINTLIDRITELQDNHQPKLTTEMITPKRRGRPSFHVVGSTVDPEYNRVVKLRQQGMSIASIAEKTGVNVNQVYRHLVKAGLNKAVLGKRGQGSVKDEAKLRKLVALKYTIPELVKAFNTSKSTIHHRMSKLGLHSLAKPTMGWEKYTPEERSVEMKRRRAVAAAKREAQIRAQVASESA